MPGYNIGLTMPHGWPGTYARQPDMIVDTHPLGGDTNILFGAPLIYGAGRDAGKVVPFGAAGTAAAFVGIAAREIKSALSYHDQSGQYVPSEAVSVLKRGSVNAQCHVGTPTLNGAMCV